MQLATCHLPLLKSLRISGQLWRGNLVNDDNDKIDYPFEKEFGLNNVDLKRITEITGFNDFDKVTDFQIEALSLTIDKVMELNPPMLDIENMKAWIETMHRADVIVLRLVHKKRTDSCIEVWLYADDIIIGFLGEHMHYDEAGDPQLINWYLDFLANLLKGDVYAIQVYRGKTLIKVKVYVKEELEFTAINHFFKLNPFLKKSEKRVSINFFE